MTMNVNGLAAKLAVKAHGGAKALKLVLVAEVTVDPADPFSDELRRMIPEIESVRLAEENIGTRAGDDGDEEATEKSAELVLPGHRLGAGSHSVTIWNLPPSSRDPDAPALLDLRVAEFGPKLRAFLSGGMPRLRIEIHARAASLPLVTCQDLANLHNAEVWLDAVQHQPDLGADQVAPKRRGRPKKEKKQADLFLTPGTQARGALSAPRPEAPPSMQAISMWKSAGTEGRVLLVEADEDDDLTDEMLEASAIENEVELQLQDDEMSVAGLRLGYGSLGAETRWWVFGAQKFSGKNGWWAHPVPGTDTAGTPDLDAVLARPEPPTAEVAALAWRDGDRAARVLAHTNARLDIDTVIRVQKLETWDGWADEDGRAFAIVWGELGGLERWWVIGLLEVGGETSWWAEGSFPMVQPGTEEPATPVDGTDLNVARGGLLETMRASRDAQAAAAEALRSIDAGDGSNGDDAGEGGVWAPFNVANLHTLIGTERDGEDNDAFERYLDALDDDQLKEQVRFLGIKNRSTSANRMRGLIRVEVKGYQPGAATN